MRKISLALTLILLLMGLTGCQQYNVTGNNKLIESDNGNKHNQENIIKVKTDKAVYSSSVKEITLEMTNESTSNFAYGSNFKMETYKNGNWYEVPFKKKIAWDTVFYNIKPNENKKEKISTSIFDYHLVAGKYRIIKSFGMIDNSKKKIYAKAEFKID